MAGERILEALTISALDRQLIAAHEEELVGLSEAARRKVPRPPRNPVFEFYGGVGAEEYVLMVVRRVPAAGLHDALLVLPFAKVIELIEHLDFWALKVRSLPTLSLLSIVISPVDYLAVSWTELTSSVRTGMANYSHVEDSLLPSTNSPQSNRRYKGITTHDDLSPRASARCTSSTKGKIPSHFLLFLAILPPTVWSFSQNSH